MVTVPDLSCHVAAVCRSLSEGKDGTTYFGSHAGVSYYRKVAQGMGLIDDKGKLTPRGQAVGSACQHISPGRSYVYWEEYERCAKDAVEAFSKRAAIANRERL